MLQEIFIPPQKPQEALFHAWRRRVMPMHRPWHAHRHSRFELVLFESGSGLYVTGSGEWEIQAGDIFVFASNEQHCIVRADEGEELCFFNIQFEPRFLFEGGFSKEHTGFCFGHASDFQNRLPRNHPSTLHIRDNIRKIEEECDRQKPEYELMVRTLLFDSAVTLIRSLGYGSREAEHYDRLAVMNRSIDYINRHLAEDMTLSEIAAVAGLSPNYFTARFKEAMGISLWEYVTERRVEAVMVLIDRDPGQSMLDIANACGFHNTANFNKAFKKRTGMTPREYRRSGVL